MSSLSVLFDDAFGWRNTIRIICAISWVLTIPMFFVPEPIRNETNRLAAEEIQKALANNADHFDHIALREGDTAGPSDAMDNDKVSSLLHSFSPIFQVFFGILTQSVCLLYPSHLTAN